MTKRFLVFQHMPWEGPEKRLMRAADNAKASCDIVEVWHEPIPDVGGYDGLTDGHPAQSPLVPVADGLEGTGHFSRISNNILIAI